MPLEIERKFLIAMPNIATLSAFPGVRVLHISQTYLLSPPGTTVRVRRIEEGEEVRYVRTEKKRLSARTAEENEYDIDEKAYLSALLVRDERAQTIEKTRYALPFAEHIIEVDIYRFWDDRAIAEIELTDENEVFIMPPCLTFLKEVTEDYRYKNARLALSVPYDDLT